MAKYKWEPGELVKIGGQELLVQYRLEAPQRAGEGRPWLLMSPDGSRTYTWVPFRGLRLCGGTLKDPARAARRERARARARRRLARARRQTAARPAAPVQATPLTPPAIVARGSLWGRLKAHFGLRRNWEPVQAKPASGGAQGADIQGHPGA